MSCVKFLFIFFFNTKEISYFKVLKMNQKDDILVGTLIRRSMRDLKEI